MRSPIPSGRVASASYPIKVVEWNRKAASLSGFAKVVLLANVRIASVTAVTKRASGLLDLAVVDMLGSNLRAAIKPQRQGTRTMLHLRDTSMYGL